MTSLKYKVYRKLVLGIDALEKHKHTAALKFFSEAKITTHDLQLWDMHAQTLLGLAETYFRLGRNDQVWINSYKYSALLESLCSTEVFLHFQVSFGKLCLEYSEFEVAEDIGYSVLRATMQSGNQQINIEARLLLAKILVERREYEAASVHLSICSDLASQLDVREVTLRIYEQLIDSLVYQGKFSELLFSVNKAIQLASQLEQINTVAKLKILRAHTYRIIGDHESVEPIDEEIKELLTGYLVDVKSSSDLIDFCNKEYLRGMAYLYSGELPNAVDTIRQSILMRRWGSSLHVLHDSWLALGTAYIGIGEYLEAKDCLWNSLSFIKDRLFYNQRLLLSSLNQLFVIYNKLGDRKIVELLQTLLIGITLQSDNYFDLISSRQVAWKQLTSMLFTLMSEAGVTEPSIFILAGIEVNLGNGTIIVDGSALEEELSGIYLQIFKAFVMSKSKSLNKSEILEVYDTDGAKYVIKNVDNRLRGIIHRINKVFPVKLIKARKGQGRYYLDMKLKR